MGERMRLEEGVSLSASLGCMRCDWLPNWEKKGIKSEKKNAVSLLVNQGKNSRGRSNRTAQKDNSLMCSYV